MSIVDWFGTSVSEIWLVPASTLAMLLSVILMIRICGLRSLSKMSSFDFVVTIALGSILATVAATATSLSNGVLASGVLLAAQWIIAQMRRRTSFGSLVDNEPLLLMTGEQMHEANLDRARVTRNDVIGKLREANVTHFDQVLAVVLETTGDISVLHGERPLDRRLLEGVRSGAARPVDHDI